MQYHLKENWDVVVDIEITHDGTKYKFKFDFIVNTNEKWPEIIKTAKSIIRENFGHSGYTITQISLSNKD